MYYFEFHLLYQVVAQLCIRAYVREQGYVDDVIIMVWWRDFSVVCKGGMQASSTSVFFFFSYQMDPWSKGHVTLALCMRQSVASYKFYLRQCITPELSFNS
jgi:hypothetical protein